MRFLVFYLIFLLTWLGPFNFIGEPDEELLRGRIFSILVPWRFLHDWMYDFWNRKIKTFAILLLQALDLIINVPDTAISQQWVVGNQDTLNRAPLFCVKLHTWVYKSLQATVRFTVLIVLESGWWQKRLFLLSAFFALARVRLLLQILQNCKISLLMVVSLFHFCLKWLHFMWSS